jgi:catechol 2,3-dioxygenase-like lactoylglutathione lyase family enzyme
MVKLSGLKGVKLPVADVEHSLRWYERVFGARAFMEFPDEQGVVRGVAVHLPGCGEAILALRHNPDARPMAGLEVIYSVPDRDALVRWLGHLDACGVVHSPVIDATVGWLVVLHDQDGHEIHLYTEQRHETDQSGRPGYGRTVASDDGRLPRAGQDGE